MNVSVVVITRNAEHYIKDLLDSLIAQVKKPYELIVVDAESKDRTQELVKNYTKKYDFIKLFIKPGTRSMGRNFGASVARGDIIAFIDADCIADRLWLKELEHSVLNSGDAVAGKTVKLGVSKFASLPRVAIHHKGVDITYPACNLAYKKAVFDKVRGFDPWFKEAEELDLNYRVIDSGFKLVYNENAQVNHRTRETFVGFVKQSFWYGFGRKELSLKYGSLWSKYDPIEMVRIGRKESSWKLVRLGIGALGYLFCKLGAGKKAELKEKLRQARISERE